MEKKDLLDKWLNGELTPEEFEVFRTIPEFSSYLKIQNFMDNAELPDYDVELGLNDLKKRRTGDFKDQGSKVVNLYSLIKIAAVLTLALASYLFVSNYEVGTSTELAQTEIYLLPDNSKVTLNENSSIGFKRFNWGSNRTVNFSGQAFFEVEKGSEFTVQTELGSVIVLGTKFDVTTTEYGLSVKCFEGIVRVMREDISIDVPAGRSVELAGEELNVKDIHTLEPGWLYNESRFEDIPVMSVLSVLKSEYELEVATENIDVNLRFTGGFPNDDLEAALQAITLPLGLNYTIENKDAITIFGSNTSD